jgi:hypothetical protein
MQFLKYSVKYTSEKKRPYLILLCEGRFKLLIFNECILIAELISIEYVLNLKLN